MNPFFSIVIPVYNVEKYLNQCVDSILSQTEKDYELILVDDGSSDNSSAICDEYARCDDRVRVIHKPNGGQADARNAGQAEITGAYVVFIDSDDYVTDNNFLADLREKARQQFDIICYSSIKYYESTGKICRNDSPIPDFNEDEGYGQRLMKLVDAGAFSCAAWSKSIKVSLLKENHITFEKDNKVEDQEWYFHVINAGRSITGIDKPYIAYRQREGSISKTVGDKNMTDLINLLYKWADFYRNSAGGALHNDVIRAALCALAQMYANAFICCASFKSGNEKQYIQSLKGLAWLFAYSRTGRARLFALISKIIGAKGLVYLLRAYCRLR